MVDPIRLYTCITSLAQYPTSDDPPTAKSDAFYDVIQIAALVCDSFTELCEIIVSLSPFSLYIDPVPPKGLYLCLCFSRRNNNSGGRTVDNPTSVPYNAGPMTSNISPTFNQSFTDPKHGLLIKCCFDAGSASQTVDRH